MQKLTDNIFLLVIIATVGTFLMVASFILIYIRNQNKLLKQRQLHQNAELAHQKELLQVIIESQEQERVRIGRDLHDDVGAAISSLRMMLEMFDPGKKDTAYHQFIKSSKSIIDKMMMDVRHIAHNLSPATLMYYGLEVAIDEKCTQINQSGKLEINFNNDASVHTENLGIAVSTALFRVLEELLNNTMKHSMATKADINFTANNDVLTIAYCDNGVGADEKLVKKGMGLQNIESRLTVIDADYLIKTSPGQGFSILINYNLN